MLTLWHKHKDKFYAATFESIGKAVGGILIVMLIYILPFDSLEKLTNLFEKYVKAETEMGKEMVNNIKDHKHDTINKKTNH